MTRLHFVWYAYIITWSVNLLTTSAYICTSDHRHCAGPLSELAQLSSYGSVGMLESYHLTPDDESLVNCTNFHNDLTCDCKDNVVIIPFEDQSPIELRPFNDEGALTQLRILPACNVPFEIRITEPLLVESKDGMNTHSESYSLRGPACGLFVIRDGNVALSDMKIDNSDCMKILHTRYGCWHRVESAPVYATGLRTLSNVHLSNLQFDTFDIDGNALGIPPLLAYFASSSAFEQLYMNNVSVSHVANVSVKFDKCTGQVNVSERKADGLGTVVIEYFPTLDTIPLDIQTSIDKIFDVSQWLGPTLLYKIYISGRDDNVTNYGWAIYAFIGLFIVVIIIIMIEISRWLCKVHRKTHSNEMYNSFRMKAVDSIKKTKKRVHRHMQQQPFNRSVDVPKKSSNVDLFHLSSDDDANDSLFSQDHYLLYKERKK